MLLFLDVVEVSGCPTVDLKLFFLTGVGSSWESMRIISLYIRFIYELSYCVLFSLKFLMVLMEVFRSYFFDTSR